MITIWQDFDPNCLEMWGKWFGRRSVDGHIVQTVGPYDTENECRAALGQGDPIMKSDLKEKLKATWAWSQGRLVNPDGPEALKRIEELEAAMKEIMALSKMHATHISIAQLAHDTIYGNKN